MLLFFLKEEKKLITDFILNFISTLYQFFIGLLAPTTNVINSIINGIEQFENFAFPILEYTLWFFNIPVLVLATSISTVALGYLVVEYITKLMLKLFL